MAVQYNPKCAGVKRLMKEAMELREPTEMYYAQPLEDNLFEWHFTVRGTIGTDFEGGIYHGRMIFPPEYPMKPPNMIILTPNGRFELNKKICLSISGYHPETWLPSWSIRTALLALIGFLPTQGAGALGSLDYPAIERKRLAKKSVDWKCEHCQVLMKDLLLPITEDGSGKAEKDSKEAESLAAQLKFQDESVVKSQKASGNENKNQEGDQAPSEAINPTPPSNENENENGSEVAENVSETTPASTSFSSNTPETVTTSLNNSSSPDEAPSIPSPTTRRLQSTSSCDYSLFVIVPVLVLTISIFVILVTRRLLLINPNSGV